LNEYGSKNYENAENFFEECISHTAYVKNIFFSYGCHSDIFQKIQVYMHRTSLLLEKMQYEDCIITGLESASLLGIHIPRKPSKEELSSGKFFYFAKN
jgi:hypothetical protein